MADGACTMSHTSPQVQVEVYADLLKARVATGQRSGGGRRGLVTRFTEASRKRLLELLAKLRVVLEGAFFVTLTYPGSYSPDPRQWKRDLDVFLKRLRRAFPDVGGIWRLEFQSRGAPHYHLLVFGAGLHLLIFRQWVRDNWYAVVGSGDERHLRAGTQVDLIKSRKHAFSYASKYAAKVHEESVPPYLDIETGELIYPGRYWGRFGELDTSTALVITMSVEQLVELRRLVARLLKARGSRFARRLKRGGMPHKRGLRSLRRKDPLGFSVFGVGDASHSWESVIDSTAFSLVWAATA